MLKKRIKIAVLGCALICALPNVSFAFDKDEFIKFLINTSYPEAKTQQQKTETKDNNYIKFYVGEENIPKSSSDVQVVNTSEYINDIKVTNTTPSILIYHTHTTEAYFDYPENNYKSTDKNKGVVSVGTVLTDELSSKGWGVVHTTKYNDESYNDSYPTSLKTIQDIKSNYDSIKIAIDLHRDARNLDTEEVKNTQHEKFTTTINGESVAKFFFVVGAKNDNVDEIKQLAEEITSLAEEKYPGITMPVMVKSYGKYNQFVADNHMLVEVGSNATTIQEAQATAKYMANVLDEYFKELK
jgi:stage II sporulation protein P